jgi:hypothetical protein
MSVDRVADGIDVDGADRARNRHGRNARRAHDRPQDQREDATSEEEDEGVADRLCPDGEVIEDDAHAPALPEAANDER